MKKKKKNKKKPKSIYIPIEEKIPRVDPSKTWESSLNKTPSWKFQLIDLDGEWGWKKIKSVDTLINDILYKLKTFETMTWGEIEKKKGKNNPLNHYMPVAQITRKAQIRLNQIRQDDIDDLYSLHISGIKRIWGIRKSNDLLILWWDPTHSVYPVKKRHT